MVLYSLSSPPTSTSPASNKVPLGDLPLQADLCGPSAPGARVIRNTPVDAARVQRVKANGRACLVRLHGDVTWDDWIGVGAAMEIVTEEALVEVGAFKWDPNNQQAVKAFNVRWEEYEAGAERNHKPLTKQERSALREVMNNSAILAWRSTLTGPKKRRLNHPKAVLNRFRAHAQAKAIPAEDRNPSPQAKLKAASIELPEELHRLKQHSDGNSFTKNDSAESIAAVIILNFDGLSNKTTKVEAIARELNAWSSNRRWPRSEPRSVLIGGPRSRWKKNRP